MIANTTQKRKVLTDLLAELGAEAAPEVAAWLQKQGDVVLPWDESRRRPVRNASDWVALVFEEGSGWFWGAYKPEPHDGDLGSGLVPSKEEAMRRADACLRGHGFVLVGAP